MRRAKCPGGELAVVVNWWWDGMGDSEPEGAQSGHPNVDPTAEVDGLMEISTGEETLEFSVEFQLELKLLGLG